jgi:hypothetical protein
MLGQQSEHLVKTLDLIVERFQRLRPVTATDEMRACVTQHARHVANQFRRRTHAFTRAKRTKIFRRISQRLLRAVSKCGQKMVQQFSLTSILTTDYTDEFGL